MFEFFVGLTIAVAVAIVIASTVLLVGMFGIMLNKKFLCWYIKKIVMVSKALENESMED